MSVRKLYVVGERCRVAVGERARLVQFAVDTKLVGADRKWHTVIEVQATTYKDEPEKIYAYFVRLDGGVLPVTNGWIHEDWVEPEPQEGYL